MSKIRVEELETLDGSVTHRVEDLAGAGIIARVDEIEGAVNNPETGLNRRVIYVDTLADLQALDISALVVGQQVQVREYHAGSNVGSGEFYWTLDDISEYVQDDTESGYYIPQPNDPTGASGGWVRASGIYASDVFPQAAPVGSMFRSTTQNRLYVRYTDEWVPIDDTMEKIIEAHTHSSSAHGLRDPIVAIGAESEAVGTYPVAIGWDVKTSSSYAMGRGITCESPFSVALGANIQVNTSSSAPGSGNIVIGTAHSAEDIGACILLGASSTSDGATLAINIGHSSTTTGERSTVVGHQSSATGLNSVAIGSVARSTHAESTAIGSGARTTAANQVVLGRNVDTVSIPGNLEVAGTKNFAIPHPDPDKTSTHKLVHSSYEGPGPGGTIYRYRVEVVGTTHDIHLPDYFCHLNSGGDVVVNSVKHFGTGYGEVDGNMCRIHVSSPGEYLVMVFADRKDVDALSGYLGEEVPYDN